MVAPLALAIKIKRVDSTLPLPAYHSAGAAAFDLYARVDTTVPAQSLAKIPTNIIVAVPPGYVLTISPRSSLAERLGLLFPNGFGIIDSDYCGPEDEILLSVYNFTTKPVTINRGERLAQGLLVPVPRVEWQTATTLAGPNRGGFGATGTNTATNYQATPQS